MTRANDHSTALQDAPYATMATITGDENVLLLVPSPGDESRDCGGFIARACGRGRPPFVMVLTDGSASAPATNAVTSDMLAALHERETRAAVATLGLPRERLLMVGLFDGTIPDDGPVYEAVVRAVTLVMWARDCNVICAPWPCSRPSVHDAVYRIAADVASRSGVGLLAYADASTTRTDGIAAAWRLDITPQFAAKQAAVAAHASRHGASGLNPSAHELFLQPATSTPELT